jgi:type IX secretion system PorP/SprF family membrane protein
MKTVYMKYLRSLLLLALVISFNNEGNSQQVPMYSQYIMNGYLVNPSFAGRDGYSTVTVTAREQWMGLAQNPATYAASFQTRILRNSYISKSTTVKKKLVRPSKGSRVGAGGYIFNDNNGIMRRTGLQAIYAYHINLGKEAAYQRNLSFGLALTAYQFAVNTDNLIYDPDDPLLNTYDRSVFIPDFNFGTSYTTSRYYVGFAMTNLLRGSLLLGDADDSKRTELGHYYLTGGIKFSVAENWTIEPSAYIKSSDMVFKSIQMDLTSRVYYKEDYWAGLSWRTNDALILLLGLKYDRFYFAYAFDFTLTDIRRQSAGTHELTMALKFGESARRYRWINAF